MTRPAPSAAARLEAARTVGAAALALLALLVTGAADGGGEALPIGLPYTPGLALAIGTLGGLAGAAWLLRPLVARVLGAALVTLTIGAFVPLLGVHPQVAGAVILWQLLLTGALLAPLAAGRERTPAEPTPGPAAGWLRTNGPAVRHLLAVSLLCMLTVVGFRLADRPPALLLLAVISLAATASSSPFVLRAARAGSAGCIAAAAVVAIAVFASPWPAVALPILGLANLLLLLTLVSRLALYEDLLEFAYQSPALLVIGSFLGLIAIGTLLLTLPAASAMAEPLSLIDAAFTATSAACVTGLIVVDTPRDLTLFGQIIVLALIQVGGLSIMVLSTFAALMLGRSIGLRAERALGQLLDLGTPAAAARLIRFIVVAALSIEGVGALVLAGNDWRTGTGPVRALWHGVFHSISAFCNAGFALHSDSLIPLRRDALALSTVMALIVLGGIGFAVLATTWERLRTPAPRPLTPLRLHARLVIVATAVMLLAGTAAFAAAEWNHALLGLSPGYKILNAAFQSATLRTAGFNTVDMTMLQPVTLLWMMAFMFVGASPGGTGGGIKTTTMVVLLATVPAIFRSRPQIVMGGRILSFELIYRSAAIFISSAALVLAVALALAATQPGAIEALLFETFSAVGTVGLSLGTTATLDSFGKSMIMFAMLGGRVGPLTLALLLGRKLDSRISYPEARIMVG